MGDTMGLFTNSDTLGTIIHLAGLIRTHDLAIGLLAFDITYCILGFLAGGVAFGGFTDGGADGIAFGVITLPGTFRVAFQLL